MLPICIFINSWKIACKYATIGDLIEARKQNKHREDSTNISWCYTNGRCSGGREGGREGGGGREK